MKLLVVLSLLAVSVAGSFENLDFSKVRPRVSGAQLPLINPLGGQWVGNRKAAVPKQFPYQVGIVFELNEGFSWCTGGLIATDWVVTAARCVDTALRMRLSFGTVTSDVSGAVGEFVMTVPVTNESVIVHEKFNRISLLNDISLIRLPEKVPLSEYIRPAKLPSFTGLATSYAGSQVIVSSWGLANDGSNTISPTLGWTESTVMTNSECSPFFPFLESSVMCIRPNGNGKLLSRSLETGCSIDTGAPAVQSGTNMLVGVSSFSANVGCELAWPTGFSSISGSILSWIMANANITP